MANNGKHTFVIFIERPIMYLDFNPFSLPCLIRDPFCRCLAERIKCISYPVEREETHDQRLWQGAQVVKTLLWLKNLFVCRIGLELAYLSGQYPRAAGISICLPRMTRR